jgi:DUF2971 family protein
MRLFKYVRSASAVRNMARGAMKFTPIDELNDPSEFTPVVDRSEVRTSLEALRKNGMTQDQYHWLKCQGAVLDLLSPEEKVLNVPMTLSEANRMLSLSAYENLDYMEEKLFSTVRNIRSKVGMLSLSARYDSLPMWAHYANQARGFVVVLEDLERSFNGDETGSLNIPKPVVYAERFIGMTFDPSTQDRLFFSKLSDWSYEREWRVVTALSACYRSPENDLYLRDIDSTHLTHIICGWQNSADEILSIGDEIRHFNPNAKVVSAMLDGGRVSIKPPLE